MLKKAPVRNAKCPDCKKKIFVRTKQKLYRESLLTKEQADVTDEFRVLCEAHGLTQNRFKQTKKLLTKEFQKRGFSGETSDADVLWRIYNDLIISYGKERQFDQVSYIYASMAGHLSRRGKDSFNLQVESKKAYLAHLKNIPVEDKDKLKVTIDAPNHECAVCKKLNGKEISIDEAISKMPLPPKKCTYLIRKGEAPFCVCGYVLTGW